MDATRETLLQKAESGDLSAVKEFANDKFTQMLGRVAPGATLLWQERTPDDPLQRSKHAQVTLAGKVVLCGEVSATQELNHLKDIVTQRTLTEIIVPGNRRLGFAFTATRNGGLQCEFIEVSNNGIARSLSGGPLSFNTHSELIEETLSRCVTFN
ncbi:hypothetical protein PHISCL_08621 [Aspergillus sclerotialis]|uniref:Uncharacterized protein n=1 Tax=Aspergillus sclerotialis TaxID=2070753 RepID=A0A3A2Z7F9_9EURO|nr:hypothetical protein PHISCL_08621 [Aspergillus sclerotialis]